MATSCERQLLLIDNRAVETRMLAAVAARAGWRCLSAPTLDEAFILVKRSAANRPDAVVLRYTDGEADRASAMLGRLGCTPAPILLAASTADILGALRAGAADVLIEPVSAERLLSALHGLTSGEEGVTRLLSEKLSQSLTLETMVGQSAAFRAAVAEARRAAVGSGPVLIEGEPGVGKQTFAGAIHAASPRRNGSFVSVNCRTVPRNLIDSILFGHEQGAFPGAFERRVGQLVLASGGTVYLDEVDALPAESQARLLRVLQTSEVQPLGSFATVRIDTRIVAAIDGVLADAVSENGLDPTLARTLASLRVTIPGLAERSGDVPMLAADLIAAIHEETGSGPATLSMEASRLLQAQSWPRNVRQLQSVLLRLSARASGTMLDVSEMAELASDIPRIDSRPEESPVALFDANGHLRPLDEIEADVIRLAIEHYNGRMSEVARRLGIGRSTLYRKLGELGIDSAA